jgi:drug/metabolite transporter (DMT)-like permease
MSTKTWAVLMGVLAVVIWAAIPAFVKVGSNQISLSLLLLIRFLVATLLVSFYVPRVVAKLKNLSVGYIAVLTGILGLNYYSQGLAMSELPVSWYVVVFSLNPILALLLMGLKLGKRQLFSVGGAVLGTLLFLNLSDFGAGVSVKGLLCLVLGMLTWVGYTIWIKRVHGKFNSIESTVLTQICSLLACFLIWLGSGVPMPEAGQSLSIYMPALILGLSTPVAYFAFNFSLKEYPFFGVVSQYLEPVVGVAIGLCFFQEQLSGLQWLGSVLIIISMALMG